MKLLSLSSSNERSSIVKHNVFYSTIIRSVNILISLILVPLTINYVNSVLYGIWLSLSSIVAWFSFFDIGFGLGMRNRLTYALAYHKYIYGKILVSTTYAFMIIVFVFVGFFGCMICSFLDWAYLLNIPSIYNETVTKAFQIVFIGFSLRMVLQLVLNVCQAYQMTGLASAIDMLGNFISLLFMLILVRLFAPNLICLSVALCIAPITVYLMANIILFRMKFRKVAPSLYYIRRFVIGDIASLGVKFFLIQIVCVILYQATNFIISHYCGPEQVTVYNIAYKYLYISLMFFTIIQSPLWSAFSDAYAKQDYGWMKTIYQKLIKFGIWGEICITIFVAVSPIIYKLWIGDTVNIPFHITILVGLYIAISLIGQLHAIIVNGIGKLKSQTLWAIVQGVIYVPLVLFAASNYQLEGILVSLIIVSTISIIPIIIQVNLIINKKDKGIFSK